MLCTPGQELKKIILNEYLKSECLNAFVAYHLKPQNHWFKFFLNCFYYNNNFSQKNYWLKCLLVKLLQSTGLLFKAKFSLKLCDSFVDCSSS